MAGIPQQVREAYYTASIKMPLCSPTNDCKIIQDRGDQIPGELARMRLLSGESCEAYGASAPSEPWRSLTLG